jgi:PAS domain S-box-containing protein
VYVALIIAAGTLIRFLAEPVLGEPSFAITLVSLLIAAWIGGLVPTLIGQTAILVIDAVLFPREATQPFNLPRVAIGIAVFYLVGIVVALLSEFTAAARKRARWEAEQAAEERERLQTTLHCIGDGVLVTDACGKLTLMNPVAEAMTGLRFAEHAGRPLEEVLQLVDERTGQPAASPAVEALQSGQIVRSTAPLLLVGKAGVRLPVNSSAAPVKDARGVLTGAAIVLHDQTSQRQTEQTLREADRRKDEFLATLAHELRNPLAPIVTGLELLKRADDAQIVAETRATMERQIWHMVRLIDDLLDMSRISRGKLQLKRSVVDFGEVASSAVEAVRPLIEELGHRLTLALPARRTLVEADPHRLAQVISNLLTNAARYTPRGGQIGLSATAPDRELEIQVSDNGIGIAPELQHRIFEMFAQVNPAVHGSGAGLGIGLALVRSLVQLHGGTVRVDSPGENQGSCFVVRLPIVVAPKESPRPVIEHTARARGRRYRVLVVDDNRDAKETLSRLIRMLGHQVETASDGAEAIDAAASFHPEIVVMDLGMPVMDGFEAARRIREQPWGTGMTLVAATGWGQDHDRQRTRVAGFDHHLVKPIDLGELQRVFELAGQVAIAAAT